MGVSDDTADPVTVDNLPSASVDDVKSSISEENYETTITENSAYSLGVSVFTTGKPAVQFSYKEC